MIPWLKVGIGLAVLGFGFAAGVGFERGNTAKVRVEFGEYREAQQAANAAAAMAALQAENEATAREQALQARADELTEEARNAKHERDAARADAATAADRLRIAINSLHVRDRDAPDSDSAAPGQRQGKSDSAALDLLVELLSRHGGELAEISGYADDVAAAGLSCERRYDAARAALAGQS